jgi:hypothetical protein
MMARFLAVLQRVTMPAAVPESEEWLQGPKSTAYRGYNSF